jgi:hypothetical protein
MSAATAWIERCTRCGRDDGLRTPKILGSYLVVACDCNYQHIRALPAKAALAAVAAL